MIWLQKVKSLDKVVTAPATANGAPYIENMLTIVTSTAPTGKPAVTVSTVVIMQYAVAKSKRMNALSQVS